MEDTKIDPGIVEAGDLIARNHMLLEKAAATRQVTGELRAKQSLLAAQLLVVMPLIRRNRRRWERQVLHR